MHTDMISDTDTYLENSQLEKVFLQDGKQLRVETGTRCLNDCLYFWLYFKH